MTSDLTAGPELDLTIAIKIFRYVIFCNIEGNHTFDNDGNIRQIDPFSTSISSAYHILKYIRHSGYKVDYTTNGVTASVTISKESTPTLRFTNKTLPLALCDAGLHVHSLF